MSAGRQVQHKPAMCPSSHEDQGYSAVYKEECGQHVERASLWPLLFPDEVATGVLCIVLGSPVQEQQGTTG